MLANADPVARISVQKGSPTRYATPSAWCTVAGVARVSAPRATGLARAETTVWRVLGRQRLVLSDF